MHKKAACLSAGILALLILAPSAALAMDSAGYASQLTGGMGEMGTFTSTLNSLTKNITAIAKIIVVIMTAIAAGMVAFDIQSSRKSFWNVVLGAGLAINMGGFLYGLFGTPDVAVDLGGSIESYGFSIKDSSDANGSIDILGPFMSYYIGIVKNGAQAVVPIALRLALILVMIDASIKIAMDLISGDKLKFMVTTAFKTGFFFFLIRYWVAPDTSSISLMPALGNGFEAIGLKCGGVLLGSEAASQLQPDSIATNAVKLFMAFWAKTSWTNPLVAIITVFLAIVIVVLLFIAAIMMLMVRIEFWTMALITIPLIPFGLLKQTNFLFEKSVGSMFNLAVKTGMIAFISTISVSMISKLKDDVISASSSTSFFGDMGLLLQVVLCAVLAVLLVVKLPSLVQGYLSGNPSLGAGDMKQMAMSAVQKATGAVGAAGKTVGAVRAASAAAGPVAAHDGSLASAMKAYGGHAMGTAGKLLEPGAMAGMYKNPGYQGYSNAIKILLGENGGVLGKKPTADMYGNRPSDMLKEARASLKATKETSSPNDQNNK